MTAENIYEIALALIDEIDDDGTIDAERTASYKGKAVFLIDILQRELAFCEGVTVFNAITALEDSLVISDDTALRILPYGLAAKFALADKDADTYNEFQSAYERLKRTIRIKETDITDEYNVLQGLQINAQDDWSS